MNPQEWHVKNTQKLAFTSSTVNFYSIKGETVENNLNALNAAIQEAGLNVDLIRPDEKSTNANAPQIISLRHQEFGSEHSFKVASSTAGLLSERTNVYDTIENGPWWYNIHIYILIRVEPNPPSLSIHRMRRYLSYEVLRRPRYVRLSIYSILR